MNMTHPDILFYEKHGLTRQQVRDEIEAEYDDNSEELRMKEKQDE